MILLIILNGTAIFVTTILLFNSANVQDIGTTIIFLTIEITLEIVFIIEQRRKKEEKEEKAERLKINTEHIKESELSEEKIYFKKRIITNIERIYYNKIKNIIPSNYILQVQIPLCSIVNKKRNYTYRNQLFRVLDYGIFDKEGNVIVIIELNDSTHYRQERIERDYKVQEILKNAEIPLITIWANDRKDEEELKNELEKYIH